MKKFKILLQIALLIVGTNGFSQEISPNRIKFMAGIEYTPAVSLNSGLFHHYIGIQELIIFKNQKIYTNLSEGIKFFKQEKSGQTKSPVELGIEIGVKMAKIKKWNIYGNGGAGMGDTRSEDFFNAYWQVGARGILFNVLEDTHVEVHLNYMRYYFDEGVDNQIAVGVGWWLFNWW